MTTQTSRSQVTITLGRSGQVVQRAGAVLDNQPIPAVGIKRSVRDRLGLGGGGGGSDNKRFFCFPFTYLHLSKDDLRFKIRKQTQKNNQQNMMDLRDMLSRSACSSTNNPITSHSLHGRQRVPEARDSLRHMPDLTRERESRPAPTDDRPRRLMYRDDRQRIAEPMDSRQCMPEPHEVRNRRPRVTERPIGSMTGQYSSMRTSEGQPRMGFLGNSYSPWTLDHIRRKSPDRVLNTLRGLSQHRRQAFEDSRSVAHGNRDNSEISRIVAPTFLKKQPLSIGTVKSGGSGAYYCGRIFAFIGIRKVSDFIQS
ncbi:hypothetical protein E3N88_40762 [Mikania micrantha]|uniref:Uncharacterized protein n=1 Tax=Mikania micrantha TaxID=192012 RepID=A0A5N6LNN5_9ASTR|nr:hypothetical protein E3N88_40762 [Mikania micrantha]